MLLLVGLPALGALVLIVLAVLAAGCWVVRSRARTERVSRILLAWRGDASCLRAETIARSSRPRCRREG